MINSLKSVTYQVAIANTADGLMEAFIAMENMIKEDGFIPPERDLKHYRVRQASGSATRIEYSRNI